MTQTARAIVAAIPSQVPSLWDKVVFVLLLSGPPKFRLRDPTDSLDNIVDWVVLLQIAVWGIAALWIASKIWLSRTKLQLKLSNVEILSLVLAVCLLLSLPISDGPVLTAFKVYQLGVTVLFAAVFVRLYGVRASLDAILLGSALLCVADVIAALVAPSLVFVETEFGSMRFRGDLIAQTGVVSTFALMLLLCSTRKRSAMVVASGIALFGSVLLLSLMRTSYFAFGAFLLLAVWKGPEIRWLKRIARWALFVLPLAMFGGALAQLEEYRAAESIWSLSDRLGLWAYLIDMTWTRSPWLGLGYFAASRIYGPEYNRGLGTAHSVFVEVLCGGGIVSFAVFLVIWILLLIYAWKLAHGPLSPTAFAALGLLLVTTLFVLVGAELESDPAGFTLWILVASLPILCRQQEMMYQAASSRAAIAYSRLLKSPNGA
jgi:hypothetical protein